MADLPWLDDKTIRRLLPISDAVTVIEDQLRSGWDPSHDPARVSVASEQGELLLMPSHVGESVGVKLVGIAPGNPDRGLPRIQAVYVLFRSSTMTPLALLDGTTLTSLRTPAVSAAAARALAVENASRLVVFGCGPQAFEHVHAMRSVRPIRQVTVVGRDQGRTEDFAQRLADRELLVRVGGPKDVVDADIVVCATTAATPVFDGTLVPDRALVVAVGSHQPDRAEVDAGLVSRSTVVVEHRATALREAGDVIAAIAAGTLDATAILELADFVAGVASPRADRPRVFKSVGMAWQDLVCAAEVFRRSGTENCE